MRRRETSDDEAESFNPERNYEDEINEVSRSLSESGVQLMFPRALEILLDFTFFDIDEGRSFTCPISWIFQSENIYAASQDYGTSLREIVGLKRSNGSTLSVLIAGLNRLSCEQDNARIVAFSGHLSKVE